MDQEKLERDGIGFRCRGCGITVWRPDLLVIAKELGVTFPKSKPSARECEKLLLKKSERVLF